MGNLLEKSSQVRVYAKEIHYLPIYSCYAQRDYYFLHGTRISIIKNEHMT